MKIACVQSEVVFGDVSQNLKNAASKLGSLSKQHVELVVFPEAYLTGYCVDSLSAAQDLAIPADLVESLQPTVDMFGMVVVIGFIEAGSGYEVYNSVALLEPGKPIRIYRKVHLPELGVDNYVTPGDQLPVFETKLGKLGILICYDMRFPEAARTLALKGAEIIVLPTNWPEGAETSAEHICIARAAESRVFLATCNRVGEENGFRFIGQSKIIHPTGRVLAAAGLREEVIVDDIDLSQAREKRTVNIPGKYELDIIGVRRPDLYGIICDPIHEPV